MPRLTLCGITYCYGGRIRGFARSRCWLGESLISLPVNENRREENKNNQPETVGTWGISRTLDLPDVKRQIAEMVEV